MASRKRAITDDIPSSSILAPQSAAIGPDIQRPQTLVPMLQSLFKGQLIIMHSLQELAHNRPIITLEHFLEQVAWPESQLPLVIYFYWLHFLTISHLLFVLNLWNF